MVIINPTHNTQPAALLRPAGPAPVLAPDRVMNAVVLGERAQHLYELASGSLRMMAESQTPLRKGEQLQLQVVGRDAQQRPELRIMQRDDVNIAPILRDRLPQQQGLNQLMATLSQLSQQLSPSVQKLLAPVLASIPHRKQLSDGERVKTALQNSGQFFEAKLLKNAPRNLDFKAALLKLAAQLDQQAFREGHHAGLGGGGREFQGSEHVVGIGDRHRRHFPGPAQFQKLADGDGAFRKGIGCMDAQVNEIGIGHG